MTFHGALTAAHDDEFDVVEMLSSSSSNETGETDFDRLEWRIIHSAREDRLWTIRPPGRLRRFINWLSAASSLQLANERLEALRKAAVLTWHYGFSIPGRDVEDFLAAGFSPSQYELMVHSISDARTPRVRFAQ